MVGLTGFTKIKYLKTEFGIKTYIIQVQCRVALTTKQETFQINFLL